MYSTLENLYFSVVRNLGFTSMMKLLTSSTIGYSSLLMMPVHRSISGFHKVRRCMFLAARIKLAAATSEGLYFKRLASRRAISYRYCAK